jgi:hypothetical protein
MPMSFARQHSPAAERNRQPILEVLLRRLAPSGTALEIASGTGQHAAHFAAALPGWTWQPSEASPDAFATIAAWCIGPDGAPLPNVPPALTIDVTTADWSGVGRVDAIFCANLLHIAPWAVCPALMAGAARHLASHGKLLVYGPFLEGHVTTAPTNLAFDQSLRARNPAWGLRRAADVLQEAARAGLQFDERVALPANNLLLAFRRAR